jgi:hypothetical protein
MEKLGETSSRRAKKKSDRLVLIDDAGDPGFKFERGSARFFVIACVVFNDLSQAEAAAEALEQTTLTILRYSSQKSMRFGILSRRNRP